MNGGQMYLHTHHSLSQQENQPRLGVVGWKNPPAPPTSSLGVRPAGQEENKPSWAATWGRAGGADSQRTWIVPYGTTKHKDLQRLKEDWRSPSLWQTHILIISHQTLHLCSRKFDKILCIYSQNLRKTKLVPQTRRWKHLLDTDRPRQLVTKSPEMRTRDQAQKKMGLNLNLI